MSIHEILQHATSPAHQRGSVAPSKAALQHQNGYSLDEPIPGLPQASVAVFSGSPKGGTDAADPRAQSGLHRQDPLKLGSYFKTDSEVDGRILKCSSHACPADVSPKKRRAWLSGFGPSRSSCFIASIAWRPRNSLRSIGFWFLRGFNPRREAKRV
jgi:hypothetical protein